MSKSMNMLRQRRKDNNIKPNRRLDRKSSRGMIYENEELRLKTININAEIERGQSDIKKLRRENEMLKKEIWCLRDEYEKLDKLLKDKDVDFSSSTCTSDSESCSSCTEESEEVESSQNFENVQKTNLKNLHVEFDHLSVVPEENSTENSDKNSASVPPPADDNDVIKPDQSYPELPVVKHFFSPLPKRELETETDDYFYEKTFQTQEAVPLGKSSSDVIVKTDNQDFNGFKSQGNLINGARNLNHQDFGGEKNLNNENQNFNCGGNLEELLNDIESISRDILKISTSSASGGAETDPDQTQQRAVPYKSELNVVLMPTPMPLLGFEKYENLRTSMESLGRTKLPEPEVFYPEIEKPAAPIGFCYGATTEKPETTKPEEICSSRSNLLELTSSDHVSSENEEILKFHVPPAKAEIPKAKSKMSIRRKVSIHFKGKKEKEKKKLEEEAASRRSTTESKKSTEDLSKDRTRVSLEGKSSGSDSNRKNRKSVSVSPERKHGGHHKKHKKVAEKLKQRRSTISTDRIHRERSLSVCTDRSNFIDNKMALGTPFNADDYLSSNRERTNSLSSSGTIRMRKMSNISNFPTGGGKIPWCGCWGNGCI